MPDSKDINSTEPLSEFDLDSTVQLNLGKDGNLVSTSAANDITPDDFEKTLDGLFEIEEMLESGKPPESGEKAENVSPSSDEINFDELNEDIEALAQDEQLQAAEEQEATAAVDTDENEFLITGPKMPETKTPEKSYKGLPLLAADEPEAELEVVEEPVPEDKTPVIELTEEMLKEPEPFPETDEMAETAPPVEKTAEPERTADIPELTTTERHVISDATAAIKEMEEEERIGRQPMEPAFATPPAPQPAQASGRGSGIFPVLLGLLGMAAGGFGAWMAFDANNRVEDLKRQIQGLNPAVTVKQNRAIADIQQRLGKIERRLTGTPTIEAAAPLMSTGNETKAATGDAKTAEPAIKTITPQTEVANTPSTTESTSQPKGGDWVINLSSHTRESLATKELNRLKKLGLNAEVYSARIKDRTWYRIRITGFASKEAARAQLNDVRQKSGLRDIWIGKK